MRATTMRIDRVTLMEVQMDLVTPFRTSSLEVRGLRHALVRAEATGLVGWGECAALPDPHYVGETAESAWLALRDVIVPAVLGVEWSGIEELVSHYRGVRGNTFARAAMELAAWDLLGKSRGQSLAAMLGGTRSEVASGVVLGLRTDRGELLESIARHVQEGCPRVKLKIAPGKDVALVEAVRGRFPELALMVDANSAYTLADAPTLARLDAFDLMMIEQPLAWDDFADHAELQTMLRTPICLDESIGSFNDARTALALGSCRVLNIKPGRVGGLLEAKRIHDLCMARGVPVWCGGMLEFGIGRAANLALASLPGFTLPGDNLGSDRYFTRDLVEPVIRDRAGILSVPRGPGIGCTVDEEHLRRHRVRAITLTAHARY
ncbi:o-succinylbenzoate synthase [Pendulispora albinea]|uniref:o-succinylbenzoate synthase n=1 Tax=Pendulispora albinea TaxID=2741071 RepID=A0ABZ2LSQ8_9BACT